MARLKHQFMDAIANTEIVTPYHLEALNAQCLFNLAHYKRLCTAFDNNLQTKSAKGMEVALGRFTEKIFEEAEMRRFLPCLRLSQARGGTTACSHGTEFVPWAFISERE
ncbi:MAG TPA: hypothetical protein VGX94_10880 [Terriglobia bacterium]|nr:hypothetical protein [Terriglobia bacterium]